MKQLALIQFLGHEFEDADIDNSLPSKPNYPNQGLPKPPGSIGTLPVFPFDPDNSLPSGPNTPSNPIQLHPGLKLVVKWVACLGFIAVPDNSLPPTPEPK